MIYMDAGLILAVPSMQVQSRNHVSQIKALRRNTMSQCYNPGDFKKYFNENMSALGAPVPQGLFDSYQKAT